MASGFPRTITQNSFVIGDVLSFVHGSHSLRLGGSLTRMQDYTDLVGLGSFLHFLSWPDFALTIAQTNSNNVFGISEDRAQLSGKCPANELVKAGATASNLGNYFNVSCFTTPPVIGADNIGTAFGNSGTGIVNGPGQANLDMAISRVTALAWPREESTVELRAEFFNALNHPQFANPDTNFSSPTFGVISSASVNPRVGQVALRLSF